MGESFVELFFWIVVFIVFFFGFKKLQKRKEDSRLKKDTSQSPERKDATDE